MKAYFQDKENRIVAVIFLITMLIACSPLISRYCINGHDVEYHLLRIESLKEGILMGRPFLKINVLFFGGAGYASSLFYPDFLLYFPALLRVCGVGINASYHLFIALCLFLCYGAAYYCIKRMTGSRYAGAAAGVLLTLCQYHMDDVYIRSAAGEYTAFIFLPFVIYGIYNVLYEEMDKPWVLGVGFGGVLLCHTSTFVMCLALGIAAFLLKWRVFAKKPMLIGRVALTAALTAAVTIFYWLPVMEQLLSAQFYVSIPWMEPVNEAVRFAEILYPIFPSLGFLLLLFWLPRIFLKKDVQNEKLLGFSDCLTAAGMLFALLATDLVPWDRIGIYLLFVQFPWRFFIMSSVLFSLADALILFCCTKRDTIIPLEKMTLLLVLFVMSAGALTSLSKNTEGYYDYSDDYYMYQPYTANVIAGEWLPQTVTEVEALVAKSGQLLSDTGEAIAFERIKNAITVPIEKNYAYVDIPFIYYKGYSAYLIDENGAKTKLPVTDEGDNGFCRIFLGDQMQGSLTVVYDGTFAQGFAIGTFAIAVLGLAGVFVIKKRSLPGKCKGASE